MTFISKLKVIALDKNNNQKKNGLLFDSALLFAANVIGSVVGFAFHLLAARFGGPAVYADLGSLLSLNILLSVAAFTIQTYVAARVTDIATKDGDVKSYLGHSVKKFLKIGIPAGFLIAISTPLVADFLHLQKKGGVVVVGLIVIPLFIVSVMRGGFQGTQRFMALGALRVVEPTVQLIVGIVLIFAGLGATGAIGGTGCGILATSIIGVLLLKPCFKPGKVEQTATARKGAKYLLQIALFLLFVTCFTNFDVLLVKHLFAHGDAAQYVAASFMSRILFLSAVSIGFALFPKTASQEGGVGAGLLFKAVLYFLIFAIPFVGFCTLFPQWVVKIFYGNQYLETANLLPKMLFAYLLIGLSYLVGMYRLSRARRLAWITFALATLLQMVLVVLYHPSTIMVAWFMAGCSLMLFALTLIPSEKAKNG